jgi:hypothetical protein
VLDLLPAMLILGGLLIGGVVEIVRHFTDGGKQ